MVRALLIVLFFSSCAYKNNVLPPYIQCNVPVSAKWKRPPEGTLQYLRLKSEPKCNPSGNCYILRSDWNRMVLNLKRTEFARQSLVDQFEALTNPYK